MRVREFIPREVSRGRVRGEIIMYISAHPGKDAFDATLALRIRPDLAISICDDLVGKGVLEYSTRK